MNKIYRNNYTTDIKLQTTPDQNKDIWNSFSDVLRERDSRYSSDEVLGDINPQMDRIMGRTGV
ncbi:MAG TPA: hypothetical protein H9909_00075 [Candidatus Mediterraneibacter norfolkensis]|nr:hypothetical protein [Candidatus Mediterraneibacter norfolkensis]